MNEPTRGAMLADLAAAINELVEPRHHAEILETEVITGPKRKRVRRRHITTLLPLLAALEQAAHPEATGEPTTAGSFESRPPASVDAVHALRTITIESGTWARALGVKRETLPARLRGLVGATMTDGQLGNVLTDARRWVRVAKNASREDAPAFKLNQPCPYCARRNAITVAGDLSAASCTCGVTWDEVTVGLLGQMVAAAENDPPVTVERCWQPACTKRGGHDVHQDSGGRFWRDTCAVTGVPSEHAFDQPA